MQIPNINFSKKIQWESQERRRNMKNLTVTFVISSPERLKRKSSEEQNKTKTHDKKEKAKKQNIKPFI